MVKRKKNTILYSSKSILDFIIDALKNNKVITVIIVLYFFSLVSIIKWGIPNVFHPFPYHMDEWHQLQAVRHTFKYGTPNIPGSAHGPIFQFLLTGIYLVPFAVLQVIDPFAIKSSLANLDMQEKIFIVLRLNTLLFGVLSIILLAIIVKKYIASANPVIAAILFVATPAWVVLSNYFKYDIALVFWILVSLLFLLRFGENLSLKNYIIAAVPSALAFATKVSAAPIILIYLISFFYFTPAWRKHYKSFVIGFATFIVIFVLFGIPDLIFRLGDYNEYLYSNLISGPRGESNYILSYHPWIYLPFVLFPTIFGYAFYIIFLLAVIFWTYIFLKSLLKEKLTRYKNEFFVYICFLIFFVSLIPLGLGATGNRLLVILPFLAILGGSFIVHIFKQHKRLRLIFYFTFIILICFQLYQTSVFIFSRLNHNVFSEASSWMIKNLPTKSTVGIENVPIYQAVPDVVLKEYYGIQENKNFKTNFHYVIVDTSSKDLPEYIVVTDRIMHEKYLKKSPKKDLLVRLRRENYTPLAEFEPYKPLLNIFGNYLNYYLSGLGVEKPIAVFSKF